MDGFRVLFCLGLASALAGCATTSRTAKSQELSRSVAIDHEGRCAAPGTQRMSVAEFAEAMKWRPVGASSDPAWRPATVQIQEPPDYPRGAMERGMQGAVRVLVLISETGEVTDAKVVCATHDIFVKGAIEQFRGYRYTPATVGGKPTRDVATSDVTYVL